MLELIEKNINRKYFSEKKADAFFEACFALKDPAAFVEENVRFKKFIYDDLKLIIQSVKDPENVVNLVKFAVFFRLGGEDPEIFELLADQFKKNVQMFTTDQVLTILVNFSHSLSPETKEVFELANDDFVYRLDANFNAASRESYI